jgi:ketosteroid isomerase-like protein
MTDTSVMLEQVQQHWEYIAKDIDRSHAMYHEDAVLEFPQSGERFEGLATFKEWRTQYPATLRFRIRRMTARENLVVVECSISYGDGPWQFGVQLLNFRDDKVIRERIYVMEGWDAPEWRAPWRADTPADPPA